MEPSHVRNPCDLIIVRS